MPWTLAAAHVDRAEVGHPLAERVTQLAQQQSARGMRAPGFFDERQDPLAVVLPSRFDGLPEHEALRLKGLRRLLESHRASLESELGASLRFENAASSSGPRWLVGPTRCTPELAALGLGEPAKPVVKRLLQERILITDAPGAPEIYESLSLLRSFAWSEGDSLEAVPCQSAESAFLRIAEEVAHTWPSFRARGLDWLGVCRRYAKPVALSLDPVSVLRAMVAELGDAHTAVRKSDAVVPPSFRGRVLNGEVVLHEVPCDTAAWQAGAREGFRLLGVDVQSAWQCSGATPQQRPFTVPHRMLSGARNQETELVAVGPEGQKVRWVEAHVPEPAAAFVSWRRLPSGAGYLRIRQWPSSNEIATAVDAAFEEFARAPGLVVDVRGNPGGDVSIAFLFRDRFVHERTRMGTQQFTRPDGELAVAEELWAEPAPVAQRWSGPVRFLTDPATYSASEDMLLGLQGLEHVQVIGMPSGGGSGQARSVQLLPGWHLTVSSCLTFDRSGQCIEGAGIPVDTFAPMGQHTHSSWEQELLAIADRGW